MVNTALLQDTIKVSGKKMEYLADKCGLSRQGLYRKINGTNDFTAKEIFTLCIELGITSLKQKERIFFAPDVARNGN